MATKYRPIDAGWIRDPYIRALVDEINRTLGDWSSQFNTNSVPAEDITTGKIVTSIEANNTQKRSGALKFQDTATINVASAGQSFTWAVDTDGLIELITAVPTVTYGDSQVEGTAATVIRTDATLPYPSALGVAASPISDKITLTDDATEGALLTASSSFLANSIALLAPNATNALRIGKYGNLSMAGTALSDTQLITMQKTNYDEAATTPRAMVFTVTNTNVGTNPNIIQGFLGVIAGPCSAASAALTTNNIIGGALSLNAGATNNNFFTGNLVGFQAQGITITGQTATAGPTVPLAVGFQYGITGSNAPLTIQRGTLTDHMGFRARMGATLVTATVTNATGFRCEAITQGTNRYGVDIAAITTGTPTVAYGVQVATHSVGTTRRSFIGGNTVHCTANDFLCDTAAKGLIVKDSQGTPEYWRIYPSISGATVKDATWTTDADGFASFTRAASATGSVTLNLQDTGTAAPTT